MEVLITRTKVKPEKVSDVNRAAEKLFAAIRAAAPRNVRVASSLLADGATFVTFLQLQDGAENPLPSLPAYREFLETLRPCVAEPPVAEHGKVVVAYGLQ
ncbi:hypothetical protein [Anaeromyxobacter terrae]|uniref:hypothetical protein n=1 Tax=Anaeromyxobacter terrae TaxID=2925406 RepID=UPI001F57F56E|nr:hypothetical protein [Anaeromyxobacter sp. SG22]